MLRRLELGSALAAVVAAGIAFASPAVAGGSLKDEYVAPLQYNWAGIYVGAQVGYQWGDARHSFSNGAPSDNSDPDGFIGGGHIGINGQSGTFVYGVEADFEGGGFDGGFTNLTGGTSVGAVDLDWQGSLRARVGIANGPLLFYITGGWAFGRFEFTGGPAPAPACCGYRDTLSGWTVGAGSEWMLSRNMTVRLEYRYTDFGNTSGALNPTFPGVLMPVDLETHAVRVGASYKF